MNRLEVQIMGQNYLLGCPEGGEENLLLVAQRVDQAMCKIRDQGRVKARDRIAVLAALNLAGELLEQAPGQPAPPAAQAVQSEGSLEQQAQALLLRLDAALAEDGQLL
jgi:cell division protein ZapA